jgi:hypothetical protein
MKQTLISLEATPGGAAGGAAGETNPSFYRSIEATPLPDAPPKLETLEVLIPGREDPR